jgi:hypothetical protein
LPSPGQARSADISAVIRTEIGELNGLIVQKAKDAGCPAPTHERIVDISCVVSSAARSRHGRSCYSMHDTGLDRKQQRI